MKKASNIAWRFLGNRYQHLLATYYVLTAVLGIGNMEVPER
jgi:hypothetical protein